MYNITSSEMEFKNYRKYSYMLAGRPLVIETGKMAGLANGSCLVRYGDTVILADTKQKGVVLGKPDKKKDMEK